MPTTAHRTRVSSGRNFPKFGALVGKLVVLTGLSAAIWTTSVAADKPQPLADWSMVAFETRYWGNVQTSWTILPDGSGNWTTMVKSKDGDASEKLREWHEFKLSDATQAELAKTLRALPIPAPDSAGCDNFMTDMAYGIIRLTKGATTTEITWNAGCMDASYLAFLDQLKAADTLVANVGKKAPVQRTEPDNP
jgi:hypothetical protein